MGCAQIGCGLVAFAAFAGILVVVYLIFKNLARIKQMKETETTTVSQVLAVKDQLASSTQMMELKGFIKSVSPVRALFSGIETVYSKLKVIFYYSTGTGDAEQDHQKTIFEQVRVGEFSLCDDTGEVPVMIDPSLKVEIDKVSETEVPQPIPVEDLDIVYPDIPPGAHDISYEYVEENFVPGQSIYFIGHVGNRDGILFLSGTSQNTHFITDRAEKSVRKDLGRKKANLYRWLLFAIVCFIISFIGFYGKPAGLAEFLRNIMEAFLDS